MRKIGIERVHAGDRLAKSIYINNRLLLSAGMSLTPEFIERLKKLGYCAVYINDGRIDDVVIDDAISEQTRNQAVRCIRELTEDIKHHRTIKVVSLKKTVSDIIDDLVDSREMMLSLADIRSFDDYTFQHSINVTIISIMIGMAMYYTQDKLRDLGLGVLLHDIGKTQVPSEIINKPSRLTEEEFEVVKKHTWHGFELLRHNPEIKTTSAHVALQHHERVDGTGYPRGLTGKGILEFARISTIADVFDALSNDRAYRKKMTTYQVYQFLLEKSGTYFDSEILDKFIQKITLYPQGTKVILNDGRSGFVIKQNPFAPKQPILRLFWDVTGKEFPKPVEVNLICEPSLKIYDVLEQN